MVRVLTLFIAAYSFSGNLSAENEFLCFSDPKFLQEKLCYPLGKDPKKTQAAEKAVLKLADNLNSPCGLISLEGELRESYTDERFGSVLGRHYSPEILGDIYQVLTVGENTLVLLKNRSALLYRHKDNKIVFGSELPTAIIGAQNFYGSDSDSKVEALRVTESNCNLQKDGIYFISPSKDSFYNQPNKSICGYRGRFFSTTQDNEVKIRRFDQIGKGWSELRGDFHKFLLWMNEKS